MAASDEDQRWAAAAGVTFPLVLTVSEASGAQTEVTVSSLYYAVADLKQQLAKGIAKDPMHYCLKLFVGEKQLQDDAILRSVAEDLVAQQFSLLVVVEKDALLPKGARKRVEKELGELQGGLPDMGEMLQEVVWENPGRQRIVASIKGKPGTPYAEGVFDVEFVCPVDYPFKPPRVSFRTEIWAAHVGKGRIKGIRDTSDVWSPANTIPKLLQEIYERMEKPEFILRMYPQERDRVDLPNPEAARQLQDNPAEFDAQAKEWTRLYAARRQQHEQPETA
ncbi:UBC11 [Symbiodinium natans]|uniref:UBC11 protein n=1 Tax=Symbiodinium natans TaxID=878477 RepID=A0A812N5Q8_9DINO|nr:UBC11 [Symbiodinium natans]